MATRPARRPSKLAGEHPAYPPPPEPAPPAATCSPTGPGKPTSGQAGREKLTVTLNRDVVEEAKNAWWASLQAGRHVKFAHFIEAALTAYTEHLRRQLNNDQPFAARPPAALHPGRPVG